MQGLQRPRGQPVGARPRQARAPPPARWRRPRAASPPSSSKRTTRGPSTSSANRSATFASAYDLGSRATGTDRPHPRPRLARARGGSPDGARPARRRRAGRWPRPLPSRSRRAACSRAVSPRRRRRPAPPARDRAPGRACGRGRPGPAPPRAPAPSDRPARADRASPGPARPPPPARRGHVSEAGSAWSSRCPSGSTRRKTPRSSSTSRAAPSGQHRHPAHGRLDPRPPFGEPIEIGDDLHGGTGIRIKRGQPADELPHLPSLPHRR